MTDTDGHGRREPPPHGTEAATLIGFLDFQRDTLEWKTSGLDASQMSSTIHPTTMTLGGLLKHVAYVEDDWTSRWLHGIDRPEPWASIDWSIDPDWEWNSARDDDPDELIALWRRSVERSQRLIDQAITDGGLDQPAARSWPDGRAPSLRWILVHLIEEYARHNGHADLLRQAADGSTGE